MEDSCLFEDLSEINRRLGGQGGDQDEQHQGAHLQTANSRSCKLADEIPKGLAGCSVSSSGYHCYSGMAAYIMGPFSLPCELDVLVVNRQPEADDCDIDTDGEPSDLDTLHNILVSTSLSLD